MMCSVWAGLTQRRSFRLLLGIISINAIGLGIFLAVQHSLGKFAVPWGPWTFYPYTSTFVYKNHAAAYFSLCFYGALALSVWSLEHGIRTMKRSSPTILWALVAASIAASVAFTYSRGATLLLIAIFGVFCMWLLWWKRTLPSATRNQSHITLAVTLILLLFLGVAARFTDFSEVYRHIHALADRQGYQLSVGYRIQARNAAMLMLRDSGFRGIGAGGFRYLFPDYAKHFPEIYQNGSLFWQHAHCDWLEMAIELGAVGSLLLLGAWCWGLRHLFKNHTWDKNVSMVLTLGLAQTSIHAVFDFPFQCPAIAVTWCVLFAVAGRWAELSG